MRYLTLILFLLLTNQTKSQCLKANISILLDWSGSESGFESKLSWAAYDFSNGLKLSEDGVKISITNFFDDDNSSTRNYHTFVNLTSDIGVINSGINQLSKFGADGGTHLSEAIDESVRQITSDGREDAQKIIIIISDGDIYDYLEVAYKIFEYRKTLPLSIFAVQIGGELLPQAPLIYPGKPLQLGSLIGEDGFERLSILCGNTNRVTKSNVDGLVEALKKLDICL